MSTSKVKGCINCAYLQEENGRMWCPFHDLPVTKKNVCNSFLSKYDAPDMVDIMEACAHGQGQGMPQYTARDKFFYGLTWFLLAVLVGNFVYQLVKILA